MQGSTFGTPGVEKYAHFLRNVSNAVDIRKDIIKSFTLAFSPGEAFLWLDNPGLDNLYHVNSFSLQGQLQFPFAADA